MYCKTNGRECEHGLRLALTAIQVCLMSHCCDYQHGALAQLEAPQVNHRGETSVCTAGGPQTTLMGFHLLLVHWTLWKATAHDAFSLVEGANTSPWLKLGNIRDTSALPFLACRSSCPPLLGPEFPLRARLIMWEFVWIRVRVCFCSRMCKEWTSLYICFSPLT